jgi:nicotinate phosphoribosyltransferase
MTRMDAKLWDGARQDSGDLIVAAQKYIDKLVSLDVDPMTKVLVPSDSLTDDAAIAFARHFEGKVKGVTAGIGTSISNDCGFKPLNMVIKMVKADFGYGMIPVVKLSDVPGKYTGDTQRIAMAKQELGINN